MAEISNIVPSERKVEIVHPGTGEPLGIRVGIMSINDERLARQKRAFRDEANRLATKGKFMKAEQEETNSHLLLFAATTGWDWYNPTGKEGDEGYDPDAMPTFHGEVPDYNQKNVVALSKEKPWFAAQLTTEIDEEKAFFTN